MKSHHLTSLLITGVLYYAAYWDAKVGVLVRLADGIWLIIAFTLPLMLISDWTDLVRYKYWVPALFLLGTLIFSWLGPWMIPDYHRSTDGFTAVLPSALIFFGFTIFVQLCLNYLIHLVTRRM